MTIDDTLHVIVWDFDKGSTTDDYQGEFQVHVSHVLSDIPKKGGDYMRSWKLINNSSKSQDEEITGFVTLMMTITSGMTK